MDTPNVAFNINDLTFAAGDVASGRSGVIVKTKRGPVGAVNVLVTSWTQFKRLYGGLVTGNPGPLLCKRALDRGSALRISRALHYTTISNAASYDAVKPTPANSNVYTLSGNLAAGHTATYSISGAGSVNQTFSTDSITTLKALAIKIKATFAAVYDVIVVSGTKMIIIPSGAAITTATFTVTGTAAPTVTASTANGFLTSAGNTAFTLNIKYPGADYNNVVAYVGAASNGQADSFDLNIVFNGETDLNESYKNIKIPGAVAAANSSYLDAVVKGSELVDVIYGDLSGETATPVVPITMGIKYYGGTDGGALTASDYIGDSSAKTGIYAFDGVDDVMQVGALDDVTGLSGVAEAFASYAAARTDLQSFIHLAGSSESAVVAARGALNINTPYAMFFAGGVKQVNPNTGVEEIISELGDVFGIAAYSESQVGPWFSFSGPNRGIVTNCLGSGNSWGAPGNKANLDLLANRQINAVIDRNKKTVLWGGFTSQVADSQMSFGSIARFNIYLKKALGPVMENFIEEPNEILTWKKIYLTVVPFLDSLVSKRAMYSYRWEGDQFAKSLDDLVINKKADIDLGKYKAKLFCKDIVSLQEFGIEINLTPSGISFEDAIAITQ